MKNNKEGTAKLLKRTKSVRKEKRKMSLWCHVQIFNSHENQINCEFNFGVLNGKRTYASKQSHAVRRQQKKK